VLLLLLLFNLEEREREGLQQKFMSFSLIVSTKTKSKKIKKIKKIYIF